jgi:hypothetical protein
LSVSVPSPSLPTGTTRRFAKCKKAGEWPPAGLDYHVCFGSDGDLKVSEIWNSREQFEAFGKRLMPILAGVGTQLANPPDIFDVHSIVKG